MPFHPYLRNNAQIGRIDTETNQSALPSPLARGNGRCFLWVASCLQDLFSSEINLQKESYTINYLRDINKKGIL